MKRLAIVVNFAFVVALAAAPAFAQSGTVTGSWKCVTKPEGRAPTEFRLDLVQKGAEVTGTGSRSDGSADIRRGRWENGVLKFEIDAGNGPLSFEAALSGDKLTGTLTLPDDRKVAWEGVREGSSAATAATTSSVGVAGTWKVTAKTATGAIELTMDLKQEGNALSGRMTTSDGNTLNVTKLSFSDKTLRLTVPTDEGNYDVEGKLDGERLAGTYLGPNGTKLTWEAGRAGTPPSSSASAGTLSGTWKAVGRQGERTIPFTLELKQEAGILSGKVVTESGESWRISKTTLSGGVFKLSVEANDGTYELEGKLEGDKITGTVLGPSGQKGTWEARRS